MKSLHVSKKFLRTTVNKDFFNVNFREKSTIAELANYVEVRIPVPWGTVAGKWWGPKDKRPVLTLHGWQDNCGSFNRLIPLLNKNLSFLAIDFPGHGYSSRLPGGFYNHFYNHPILLRYIIEHYQWSKVSLMGHSMGAIVSYIYTMLYPNDVDFIVCIDALKPMISPNNATRMAKSMELFLKYQQFESNTNEPPSYTMDVIKQKICTPHRNSIQYEHSDHIIERNVAPSKKHPGQYYFTRDPRLKVGELMNWGQDVLIEDAKLITCPIFVAKAEDGPYYEPKEYFYQVLAEIQKRNRNCVYQRFEGKHHFHLNNPERLAEFVTGFIDQHDVEDRSLSEIQC